MFYLIMVVGSFLAAIAFIFRSIAWAFSQTNIPDASGKTDSMPKFQIRPGEIKGERSELGPAHPIRKSAPFW
jgi:hypothetical protein